MLSNFLAQPFLSLLLSSLPFWGKMCGCKLWVQFLAEPTRWRSASHEALKDPSGRHRAA